MILAILAKCRSNFAFQVSLFYYILDGKKKKKTNGQVTFKGYNSNEELSDSFGVNKSFTDIR